MRGRVGLIVLVLGALGAGPDRGIPNRPNILLLLLDDQDDFTPFWDALPATSMMVRDRGTRFAAALATTPICTPSRASLLSGRLAHNTGCYTLTGPSGGSAFTRQVDRTFAVELEKVGYVNAMFGKSWTATRINPGFHEWAAFGGPHMYEGYGYEVTEQRPGQPPDTYISATYSTDYLSERMERFLVDHKDDHAPFFVWLAPTAPHLPLPPAQRHARRARRRWQDHLPTRANFDEPDVSDKPDWLRASAEVRSAAVPFARQEYPRRMGSLLAVDEMMAHIRKILVEQGKWANTVVILASDNGYNLGAHRLIHKFAPYEESIRIPLIIAGPGVAHAEVRKLVGLHDLAPTILELAGAPIPETYDGKSLVPFLTGGGDVSRWRTALPLEYETGGVSPGFNPGGVMHAGYALDVPSYRGLRTETHKYVLWTTSGEQEVYDLVADPFELTNLVKTDPERAEPIRAELSTRLEMLRQCKGRGCP